MSRSMILLVDDDPLVRQVIAEELDEFGHVVFPAEDAATAFAVLDANPDIDLALVDYALPGTMGDELAAAIRERRPGIKTALLTGYGHFLTWRFGEKPCPIIDKATRMEELARAIDTIIAGEPLQMPHNATASRLDLVHDQLSTRPAVESVRNQIANVYTEEGEPQLPPLMAAVIGRLDTAK